MEYSIQFKKCLKMKQLVYLASPYNWEIISKMIATAKEAK